MTKQSDTEPATGPSPPPFGDRTELGFVSKTPTGRELADFGHDFSRLEPEASEALQALARDVLSTAEDPPRVEVISSGQETVSDYARRWVSELGGVTAELERWPRNRQTALVEELRRRWSEMRANAYFDLEAEDVKLWLSSHLPPQGASYENVEDACVAVAECVKIVPPREVRIQSRLAQTGAQKVVFRAEWRLGEETRQVVLKKLVRGGKASEREARSHPLLMQHPNIVRTYTVKNELRPPSEFFLERFMDVLDDAWRATGDHEVVRVLADVARALAFINGQGLVHGDVKPDNVGISDGRFVLLDFGVCRPWIEFLRGGRGTGSARTRAPEVLEGRPNSAASDVWSLAATVFKFSFGRFPLFETSEEEPPKALSETTEEKEKHQAFREELHERADLRWDELVANEIQELKGRQLRLGELLEDMLAKEPGNRPSASEVLDYVLRHLASLVGDSDGPLFPPLRELAQFRAYTSTSGGVLKTMPRPKRIVWKQRIEDLEQELESEEAEREFLTALADDCKLLLETALSRDARSAVEHVRRELELRQAEEPLYKDLFGELQHRLALAAGDRSEGFSVGERREDTLGDALDHALAFPEVYELPNFERVARALEEISRTSVP